jgi:hypothetical protein
MKKNRIRLRHLSECRTTLRIPMEWRDELVKISYDKNISLNALISSIVYGFLKKNK